MPRKKTKVKPTPRIVTPGTIHPTIARYLETLETLIISPLPTDRPLELFKSLKRSPVTGGPYAGRSVFEVANRVMSDLVVLAACEHLLLDAPRKAVELRILLGNENNGHDLTGDLERGTVVGECFNVAPTFFTTKFYNSRKALEKATADLKVIAFNSDVRDDLSKLDKWCEKGFTLLPVRVPERLEAWQKLLPSSAPQANGS